MQTNRAEANSLSGCVEMLSRWLKFPKTAVFFPSQIALLTTERILSILNAVSKCTEKPVGRLLVH